MKGLLRHRINGVQKFKRDEHFLYLRQYEPPGAKESRAGSDRPCHPVNDQSQWDSFLKLQRNSSFIQPSSDAPVRKRIRRLTVAAACFTTVVFATASAIGVFW
ncbi:putative integral membrane protein [Babesia bovis T2Bo]|uniref:putative integral membrane protein n=1 Tax=Babesia bovis T2Bo TaxID=484906 RepID=UPI001DFD4F5F|nr:putative integral membrane protein [Babesia bovis T2Bo]KAG6439926.1 putative integral membrane protein [Babesia bovis T2Bo]